MPTHRTASSRAKNRAKKLLNKTVLGGVVASALINPAEATPVTDAEAALVTALTNLATAETNLAAAESAFIAQSISFGGNLSSLFAPALTAANSASASASAAETMTGASAVTAAANAITASIAATNAMVTLQPTSWYQAWSGGAANAQGILITNALAAAVSARVVVNTSATALNTALLSTSTTTNTSISSTSPTVAQTSPTVAQTSPTVAQTSPTVAQTSPTVAQASPTVAQTSPTVAQASPTVAQASPTVAQASPTLAQTSPMVAQTSPTIIQTSPTNISIDAVSSSQITTMLPTSSTGKYTISTTPMVQATASVNQIPSAATDGPQQPSISLNASSLVGIVAGIVGTALMALTGVVLWRRWVGKNKITTEEPVVERNTHPMITNPLHPESLRTLSSSAHVYLELFADSNELNQVQTVGSYYETPVPLYAARWLDAYPANQLPPLVWLEEDYAINPNPEAPAITQRSVLNLGDYEVPADEDSSTDVPPLRFGQ